MNSTVALISLYDFENNAVRQLAAALRARGRRVVEVYFKDWKNNHFEDPSPLEVQRLLRLIRDEDVGLVGLSVRASAYERVARNLSARLRAETGLPIVVGGWHATVRPDPCIAFGDAVCLGEADVSFPDFVDRFFSAEGKAAGLRAASETGGFWVRLDDAGRVRKNPPLPLVTDLDALPWRDYDSADKWVIHRHEVRRGDPMARDPLHQVMCSTGCIQRCAFCHNSFETGAPGPRLRVRSVSSVLDELRARQAVNPAIRRVRFDDEIFGLDRKWLREFADRYPREIGLPFDILAEPTVVSDTYADLVAKAGARIVHMGIQSTEAVNRDVLSRRATRETTWAAVQRLHSRGIRVRYLVMVDIPGVTEADREDLFQFLQQLPRPYDLYLFSLTWFPGSKIVEDMLASGRLDPSEVEGEATKTFTQYRVDLGWPRSDDETWWLALMILQASGVVAPRVLRAIERRRAWRDDPKPLVYAAHAATVAKTARVASRMVRDGELTATLVRRWWNPQQLITM